MGFLQNRFDLGEEEKSQRPNWGNMESVPKLKCSFLRETDEYSELCKQKRYRDEASMLGFPEGSTSCPALISRGAEKCLYRRFGSLFCLGVGVRNKR